MDTRFARERNTEKVELGEERIGRWFVATMARLLCPGSIASPPNHPSGWSYETLMQVPATAG